MDKKTVLVTGGAKRIGAAIVEELARSGWRVLVHANASAAEAESRCTAWRAQGYDVQPLAPFPLNTEESVKRCFDAALTKTGDKLDALVNNAAMFSRVPLARASRVAFDTAWQINTAVPIQLTLLLANHLASRGAKGCTVNLLDQRIIRPTAGDIPYAISKKALEAFTLSAAKELALFLRVNAVAPGAVLRQIAGSIHEPAGTFPIGRRPEATEVAVSVRFLLESPFLTGQILFADAGQHLV